MLGHRARKVLEGGCAVRAYLRRGGSGIACMLELPLFGEKWEVVGGREGV